MLTPTAFPSPGYLGLNKQQESVPLGPEWAVVADNGVIDSAGRIAARKGWSKLTSSPITGSPTIEALWEHVVEAGTTELVAAGGDKLWSSDDSGATWTDRTGSLSFTNDNYQFANFNGKCIACTSGEGLASRTTGNFATISATSGTIPSNPVAILAAFGRLWSVGSDLQTIYYSALLDETKYATADGAGTIDMSSVWSNGTDIVVALAAFNGRLVVFGRKHIIVWSDGKGSELGVDPNELYVEESIEGVGTVARDSVCNIGEGELMFLSQSGIRSLARVLVEKGQPFYSVTENIRDAVIADFLDSGVDQTKVRSAFSAQNGFYLLSSIDAGKTVCVDMRAAFQNGARRVFLWRGFTPYSMATRVNGDLLFGWAGGLVGKYAGYNDNTASYRFEFRSPFLDLGPEQNAFYKELKRIRMTAYSGGGLTPVLYWRWDFSTTSYSQTFVYDSATDAEYGISEFGIAEFGGSSTQRTSMAGGWGAGQYFCMGVIVDIDGRPFALQNITAYYDKANFA